MGGGEILGKEGCEEGRDGDPGEREYGWVVLGMWQEVGSGGAHAGDRPRGGKALLAVVQGSSRIQGINPFSRL